MPGCVSTGTFGIFEEKRTVESHFAHEGKRLGKLFLAFGVKSGKQIARNAAIGQYAAYGGDAVEIPFPGIFSIHQGKNAVIARLYR